MGNRNECCRIAAAMKEKIMEQNQNQDTSRFDNPGPGTRDTGTDTPEEHEGDRPVGTVDEDANPPMSDPTKSDVYGGTGETPPQDTGRAIPPYEGRTQG